MPSSRTLFRGHASRIALWLLALAAALFAYAQALRASFISDDYVYLVNNQKLSDLPLAQLWQLFVEPFNAYEFLPIRDLSYWADLALFGLDPAPIRVHNFILYATACFLVFKTTIRLCARLRVATTHGAVWTAAVTTALFAVHPAHVEAVVWVSGRKDLLCAIFSLSALWMALEIDARARRAALLIAAIAAAVLAALLSKATAIAIVPLLMLLSLNYFRHDAKEIPRATLLALAVVPLAVAALSFVLFYRASSIAVPQYYGVESIERFFAILGWLLRLSVSFEDRQFFYPVLDTEATPYMALLGVAVLAAALLGLASAVRRNSLRGFCAFAFFVFCLPYTQLLPFGTSSLVGDRFLFLAVWPLCLLLATASKKAVYHLALAALGLAWLAETVDRSGAWATREGVLQRDLAAWPGHALPLVNKITVQLLPADRVADARQATQSILRQDLREFAVALVDTSAVVQRSLDQPGSLPAAMGALWRFGERIDTPPADARWNTPILYLYGVLGAKKAGEMWTLLTQTHPDDAALQYNAGLWFLRHRDFSQAEQTLRKAVALWGADADIGGTAAKNWGLALLALGDEAGAERALRQALEARKPDVRAACSLSALLTDTKRPREAAPYQVMCDSGNIKTAGALSQ